MGQRTTENNRVHLLSQQRPGEKEKIFTRCKQLTHCDVYTFVSIYEITFPFKTVLTLNSYYILANVDKDSDFMVKIGDVLHTCEFLLFIFHPQAILEGQAHQATVLALGQM